jgi:hypothetical protein
MIAVGGSGSIYDTNGVFKYLETASLFAAQRFWVMKTAFFENGFPMPFIHYCPDRFANRISYAVFERLSPVCVDKSLSGVSNIIHNRTAGRTSLLLWLFNSMPSDMCGNAMHRSDGIG